ncbi:DsbA family protein [Streptomyces sp. NBC_01275]|uniref:2-hydroxychromene-2-carboxylate isomerase n=1 Tax=Streptomyces sp. NBC_01275 TaxID=2903807 RepID=UPI00224F200C|nr:DsbA family protein [Streptomyces sp. NBC_01275]MCX4763936.1 DsbA family protein [Streptomyces sp. NBC_01275]
MRRRPRVYFSFRSPYSWIAIDQLERRFPRAGEYLDYCPYWEPEGGILQDIRAQDAEVLYTPMSKAKHLYLLADIKRTAARFGSPLVWPIDTDQAWELPHLAWLKARRQGQERVLYRALVEARWHRGEPICDPSVLARAADEAGLDGADLVAAEHDPLIRAEAVEVMVAAYYDDIFGIPYFRIGRERLWGLDRLDEFVAALEAAHPDREGAPAPQPQPQPQPRPESRLIPVPPADAAEHIGLYDRDTAGGCG